jgi:hypothetical protein
MAISSEIIQKFERLKQLFDVDTVVMLREYWRSKYIFLLKLQNLKVVNYYCVLGVDTGC